MGENGQMADSYSSDKLANPDKKYRVIDLQGSHFMDYTHDEPLTIQEIREIRWQDYQDNFMSDPENVMTFEEFTIDFVCDFWEIRLEEA